MSKPSDIRAHIEECFPEIEQVSDHAVREKIVDAFQMTLERSSWDDLREVPNLFITDKPMGNFINHCRTVVQLCQESVRVMKSFGHEIDEQLVLVGALLHDLGKAVDREMEGTHAALGAEIARRFGVDEETVHCIAAHHEEIPPETTEALIVIIADAMSGSRPGARRDSIEQYVKRLEALEAVANSFEGVDQAFAIQAGREIRVLVQPERIDDLGATRLARDVSRKIEETLQYPGQIKVTVVRETRATSVAR